MANFPDGDYENVDVIEFDDLRNFVEWIKSKALDFALQRIGENFFDDPDKYKDKWEQPDEDTLPYDEVVDSLSPFLMRNKNRFEILTLDLEKVLSEMTNLLLQNMLSILVDMDVLEMCWNESTSNFMWRVKEES
jgi:hypothetical protein